MDYGKAIRIARAARGLTQKELAARMGVLPSYVSMLEKGKRNNPSVEKLSSALGIPASLLMLLGADQAELKLIEADEADLLASALLNALSKA